MIYVDVVDEQDAIAIYFDLLDDMPCWPASVSPTDTICDGALTLLG